MRKKADFVELPVLQMRRPNNRGGAASGRVENIPPRPSAAEIRNFQAEPEIAQVSVIIPYTRRPQIESVLRAIIDQTHSVGKIEVIVVGQGSRELEANWPSIRSIDLGPIFRPGKARNLGAAAATGDVLLFLDDDCIPESNWIEANLAALADESIGAVGGMIRGLSRSPLSRAVDFANFSMCQIEERQERAICSATFGIRKVVFEEIGGFDESIKVHEDIDYCHRLDQAGYETIYQPNVRVVHDHRRTTFRALVGYLYYGGREGGLEIEKRYQTGNRFYSFLLSVKNPLLYSAMVIPFALAATIKTVAFNFRADWSVIALAPLILVGKLSCHIGILSWNIRESIGISAVLGELKRLFEYTFLKRWIRTPRVITLFVTSQCNAKCGHCFYWENLNQNNDLSFEEIENLSDSLERVDVLLISGGEPFLRKELPEICELFFERNNLGQVNIPTNGLQPQKTYDMVKKILQYSKGRPVHVSLSIDGTENIHDEIRAVPGNFKKAVKTFKAMLPLQKQFPNLRLRVNTTVLNHNFEDLFEFFETHEKHFPGANTPSYSLLRGTPYDKSMLLPDAKDLRDLYEHRNRTTPGVRSFLSRHLDRMIFDLSLETLRLDTQIVPCEAGRIQGVVEDNGNVRHCELLPAIGNLREASFEEIWNSDHAHAERQKIANKECRCTHECFLYPSLLAHPETALKIMAKGNR